MQDPKLKSVYVKGNLEDVILVDFDKEHHKKPHWIKISTTGKMPRFIALSTQQSNQLFYKSFGGVIYYLIKDVPDQDVHKSLSDQVAGQFDTVAKELNTQIAQYIFKLTIPLDLDENIKILDLGAGTGLTSLAFIEEGFRNFTLVDFSEEMKKVATQNPLLKTINYMVQDATKLDLNEHYDLVVSGMLMCDLNDEELKAVLNRTKHLMNYGGYIVIVEDQDREIYSQMFNEVKKGMFTVGDYEKYYFVGQRL